MNRHRRRIGTISAGLARLMAVVSIVIASGVGAARAASPTWRTIGTGGEAHAWFLLPIQPPAGQPGAPAAHGAVFRASASANLGTVSPLRAHSVYEPPLFMSSYGDRLIFLYQPTTSGTPATAMNTGSAARSFPVRSVRVHDGGPGGAHLAPPNRYFAEAPLVAEGEVVAAADTALGFAALVRTPSGMTLHVLTRTGWTEAPLPSEFGAPDRVQLFADGTRLALLAPDEAGGALWTLPALEGVWTHDAVHQIASESDVYGTPGGLIAANFDEVSKTLTFRVVVGNDVVELGSLEGVAPSHAVARLGENLMVIWMDPDSPDRMRVAVISSITGRVLHNDFASFGAPLTPSDLRLVAFLLSAIMLGVLLFLLKPETAVQAAPPPGWALADSGRRFIAAAVDFFLAGFVSSLLWTVKVAEAIDPSHLFLMESDDNWAAMTALGIYFLHGTLGEWLFRRTLGKWLLRCRVSSTRGPRVKLWQAAARNLVKVVAPPLVALVLIDPNRRHPGDLLGGTLVVSPAEQNEEPDVGDVPGSVRKSDNTDDRGGDRQD